MSALTPAALRAMRGALDWSMRDLAAAFGVSLGTILAMEKGEPVKPVTERRIRAAFLQHGVGLRYADGAAVVRILPAPAANRRTVAPSCLAGLRYVVARPRKDGTVRVQFEVPARLCPPGYPKTRPLPVRGRTGRLDSAEVAAIKADAARMLAQLEAARLKSTLGHEKQPLSGGEAASGVG